MIKTWGSNQLKTASHNFDYIVILFFFFAFQLRNRNLFWWRHLFIISCLVLSWSFLFLIIMAASVMHNRHILLPFLVSLTCFIIFHDKSKFSFFFFKFSFMFWQLCAIFFHYIFKLMPVLADSCFKFLRCQSNVGLYLIFTLDCCFVDDIFCSTRFFAWF